VFRVVGCRLRCKLLIRSRQKRGGGNVRIEPGGELFYSGFEALDMAEDVSRGWDGDYMGVRGWCVLLAGRQRGGRIEGRELCRWGCN